MTYNEAIALLEPLKDSDKYSPNLLKFLMERVSRLTAIGNSDVRVVSSVADMYPRLLIGITDDRYFCGSPLHAVLCGDFKTFAYRLDQLRPTPIENWWLDYLMYGKCHLDPEHGWYGERWTPVSDSVRTCKWCGLTQHKTIEYVPREVWSSEKVEVVNA